MLELGSFFDSDLPRSHLNAGDVPSGLSDERHVEHAILGRRAICLDGSPSSSSHRGCDHKTSETARM